MKKFVPREKLGKNPNNAPKATLARSFSLTVTAK